MSEVTMRKLADRFAPDPGMKGLGLVAGDEVTTPRGQIGQVTGFIPPDRKFGKGFGSIVTPPKVEVYIREYNRTMLFERWEVSKT